MAVNKTIHAPLDVAQDALTKANAAKVLSEGANANAQSAVLLATNASEAVSFIRNITDNIQSGIEEVEEDVESLKEIKFTDNESFRIKTTNDLAIAVKAILTKLGAAWTTTIIAFILSLSVFTSQAQNISRELLGDIDIEDDQVVTDVDLSNYPTYNQVSNIVNSLDVMSKISTVLNRLGQVEGGISQLQGEKQPVGNYLTEEVDPLYTADKVNLVFKSEFQNAINTVDVRSQVNSIQATAESALSAANSATTKANEAKAQSTQTGEIANSAKATAEDAYEMASTADATANSAQTTAQTAKTTADMAYQTATIVAQLSTGDTGKLTVTNYPSTRGATRSPSGFMPKLSFSYKTEDDEGEYYQVVWDEDWVDKELKNEYLPSNYVAKADFENVRNELEEKADKAWSMYNSATGTIAPEGSTYISTSNIVIAAGLEYQKTLTTAGAFWVLTSNGMEAELNANEGGYFRIEDGDDGSVFEIVKGEKRLVGATPTGITVDSANGVETIDIPYNVTAQPILYSCNDLLAKNWKAENDADSLVTVNWTSVAGGYVAHATTKTHQSKMFFKASYEVAGKTYIKNTAPVKMQTLILGDKEYTLGTATIDGKTVLTLTEVQ